MKPNEDLRNKIYMNHLYNWEVAHAVGIADTTFSKWLRVPLNDERHSRVEKAISELTSAKQ